MIAVIGAPITELETAAIPDTARTDNKSGLKDVIGNWKIIAPKTPPKKRLGLDPATFAPDKRLNENLKAGYGHSVQKNAWNYSLSFERLV